MQTVMLALSSTLTEMFSEYNIVHTYLGGQMPRKITFFCFFFLILFIFIFVNFRVFLTIFIFVHN